MSMTHPENYPNTQRGATRQTRRMPTLRPKLKEMMDSVDNPHDAEDRKSVKEQFLQFLNSSAGALFRETTYLYWFENNYRSMLPDYPEPDEAVSVRAKQKDLSRAAREKEAADITQRVDKAVETRAQIILLDLIMPNGKRLRESNRSDCKHAGGWYMKLADRLKGKQLVGDVWQEAEVRKLLPGAERQAA